MRKRERQRAYELRRRGETIPSIASQLGVPLSTVRGWCSGPVRTPRLPTPRPEEMLRHVPLFSYAYVLGLYLGDGYLARAARGVYRLCIYLDSSYPRIVAMARRAVHAVMPGNRVGLVERTGSQCVYVSSYSKRWPILLPQHGPGVKHLRSIELADWQRAITKEEPDSLIRGLIHSDGCRFVARQPGHGRLYDYPRYSFSNRSDDIRSIFCEHLDLIGVGWTRSSRYVIQIAQRDDVAALDRFVGPKS